MVLCSYVHLSVLSHKSTSEAKALAQELNAQPYNSMEFIDDHRLFVSLEPTDDVPPSLALIDTAKGVGSVSLCKRLSTSPIISAIFNTRLFYWSQVENRIRVQIAQCP